MRKILHHFRRNRSYSHHERWGVFAAILVLTLMMSAGSWLMFGKPAASASSLMVQSVNLDRETAPADGEASIRAAITIVHKETNEPAAGIWVGLAIPETSKRTAGLSHAGWYSFEPGRAFYQTDARGEIEFRLASVVPGEIPYDIYAANPELKNDNKYQKLATSFWATYK